MNKNLGSSLDFGLYSCDPVKPIKGSMGYIIQFNDSKILADILESAKEHEKFAITESRLAELKRFETSFFTSVVSYCRLSRQSAPEIKNIDILADLYLDNEPKQRNFFNFQKRNRIVRKSRPGENNICIAIFRKIRTSKYFSIISIFNNC